MLEPPQPSDEEERLADLYELCVLGSGPEERFDRITRTARRLFDVPFALVSLVDRDRQWFKSRQGVEATGTGRKISFCGHAILQKSPFVICDALLDPRFADNPLVTGDLCIRFYAGVPLHGARGLPVGTLCIIDTKPRDFDASEQAALQDLAAWAEAELRRTAEQACTQKREQAEQLLAKLSARVPGLIYQFRRSPTGFDTVPYASEGIRELFELAPDDVAANAKPLFTRVHPDDRDRLAESMQQSRQSQERWSEEFRVLLPDRGLRWLHGHGMPEPHADGGTTWHGYISDVTEERENQHALHASKQRAEQALEDVGRLAEIVNRTTNAVLLTGKDHRILWVNDAFTHIYGYTLDEAQGHVPRDLLYGPHTDPSTREQIIEHLARQAPLRTEICHSTKSGQICWVEIDMQPRYDAEGDFAGYMSIATVVTERKLIEQELKSLTDRFGLAAQAGGIGVWDWDLCSNHSVWDERAASMYGVTATAACSPHGAMLWMAHPDDAERLHAARQEALAGKDRFEVEYRIVDDRGVERDLHVVGLISRNGQGRAVRLTGIVIDISSRKKVEELKAELISTISHELRTPLTSIRGTLGLVAGGVAGEVPQKAARLIEIACRNTQRLTLLVNDFLDMEKVASGRMELDLRSQHLTCLVERAVEENTGFARLFDVSYSITASDPLVAAEVDAVRFVQIMSNLLSNAAKYSPPGTSAEVAVLSRGQKACISVRDYGPGISDEFAARIFQRFARADASDSRAKGGTGLGLAISKALVERMHGEIRFENAPQGGAIFTIELPLAEAPEGEGPEVATSVVAAS